MNTGFSIITRSFKHEASTCIIWCNTESTMEHLKYA
jgi:hypothetical protein